MDLNVNLGKQNDGTELRLDLAKQELNLILLLGETGSGKSVFHFQLYKELVRQNRRADLRFIFIDNTRVDFHYFPESDLYHRITDHNLGVQALQDILELVKGRNSKQIPNDQAIIVHIEECDLWAADTVKTEEFFREFIKLRKGSNVYVVYSTSRPSVDVIPDWLISSADLKVVFKMASEEGVQMVLGDSSSVNFTQPGERILVLKDKQIKCQPFSQAELKEIQQFEEQRV